MEEALELEISEAPGVLAAEKEVREPFVKRLPWCNRKSVVASLVVGLCLTYLLCWPLVTAVRDAAGAAFLWVTLEVKTTQVAELNGCTPEDLLHLCGFGGPGDTDILAGVSEERAAEVVADVQQYLDGALVPFGIISFIVTVAVFVKFTAVWAVAFLLAANGLIVLWRRFLATPAGSYVQAVDPARVFRRINARPYEVAVYAGAFSVAALFGLPDFIVTLVDAALGNMPSEADAALDYLTFVLPIPDFWCLASLVVTLVYARKTRLGGDPRWQSARRWAIVSLVCFGLSCTNVFGMLPMVMGSMFNPEMMGGMAQ